MRVARDDRRHGGHERSGRSIGDEVVGGAADRSYGIQVAKLAGLPAAVIERARLVLTQLEAVDRTSPARTLIEGSGATKPTTGFPFGHFAWAKVYRPAGPKNWPSA